MKLKTRILGGVAVAGLISALSLTPAMAFTHHPGTPAEHQQTDDLNAQQLQQAPSGTTATNAQMAAAPETSNTTPTTRTTANATTTAPQQAASAASTRVSLTDVANPPQTLANASVETSNGQAVGAVQKVILDASGKAQTVVVALLGKVSRLVAIAANQLTFDQSRDVLIAQLSADQIQNLPIAPEG